ncbi:uncharacterized protein A1O9_00366 [Exophiala aquamarina CBS 119918]|uniref:Uncharacterized protein n=1 Tax=Exophiala aquamarina CBS 119918 TaxID=1182545 RepID=A0A072PQL8_9EURO|nr:uncharacterized protein A1O9_00366 [Exophiala aquamarina CBS 119918]KEF62394.1 hypothetical protein A1O9_00366 [Exophiala aquamarina CBS 119918]
MIRSQARKCSRRFIDAEVFDVSENSTREDVAETFDSSIKPVMNMLDAMFQRFHTKHPLLHGIGPKIAEILLVGGSSASPYLKQKLRERYSYDQTATRPYCVTVRATDRNGMSAETCIAQGAILLMMDSHFVTEKVIKRGYAVQVDAESKPGDRINRLEGERIGHYHEAPGPEGCWRGLFLDEKTDSGWVLEESVFYSDRLSEDGLWIDHPHNKDIRRCGVLKVQLTEEDCAAF